MSETKIYPLRLPRSLKDAVTKIAQEEGVSVNPFIATAVAEKRATLNTAEFFAERRERANFEAFQRILRRPAANRPGLGMN
jgi:hypothetical protein